MRRRSVVVLFVLIVLLAGGAAALMLTVKPDLDDAHDKTDASWKPLRGPLTARYEQLGAAVIALRDNGAGDRAVTTDLNAALARWQKLVAVGDTRARVDTEVTTANQLESLGRRLKANVVGSARLQLIQPLGEAISAFDRATVPLEFVASYNSAARAFAKKRDGTLDSIIADLFKLENRPVFQLGG